MPKAIRAVALPFLALAGLAVAAALVSNALASPARHLKWSGSIVVPGLVAQMQSPPSPVPLPQPLPAPVPPRHDRPAASTAARETIPVPPSDPAPAVSSPIREVSSQEAWQAFQSGIPLLDARRSAEFSEGHVAGAWCTPVWESDLEDRLIAFKATRHPGAEDPILIYCGGGDCKDSHLLATKLLNEGYFNLLIYRDGFPDWVARKRPIEKGQP